LFLVIIFNKTILAHIWGFVNDFGEFFRIYTFYLSKCGSKKFMNIKHKTYNCDDQRAKQKQGFPSYVHWHHLPLFEEGKNELKSVNYIKIKLYHCVK